MSSRIWLKNIGAANDRLPARWYDDGSAECEFRWFVRFSEAFSGKDSVEMGDVLLYHAFLETEPPTGRVVGVARVSSNEPEWKPRAPDDQWPWVRPVTPLLIVPLGGHGPTLDEIGVDSPPMGGYKEIGMSVLSVAVDLLAANALPSE